MAVTEEGLRFLLTGDVDQFERAMNDAQKAADNAAKGIVAAGKQIQGSSSYIDSMRGNLKSLVDGLKTGETRFVAFGSSVDKTGNLVRNFQQKTAAGNTTLTNFSRIIQDAPFGIIGIGNNITATAEAFGNLISKTGNATAAFKALGNSLLGAGGITLGVSILITGLTKLGQTYGSLGNAYFVLTGQISKATQVQQAYNKENEKTLSNTRSDISLLNGYLAVARDENISRDQRNKALKTAKDLYPGYLNSISLETINSAAAAAAIDKLTQSLIRKAKIQGAQNIIAKEQEKILNAQNTSLVDQATLMDVLSSVIKGSVTQQTTLGNVIVSGARRQKEAIDQSTNAITRFDQVIKNLLKQEAMDEVLGLGKKDGVTKKIKGASDVIRELEKDLTSLRAEFTVSGAAITILINQQIKRLTDALGELTQVGIGPADALFTSIQDRIRSLQASLFKTPVTIPLQVTIPPLPDITKKVIAQTTAAVKAGSDQLSLSLSDFNKKITEILATSTRDAVASVSAAIGSAVVSGNADQILGAFVGGISSLLEQLGKLLIAQGIGIEAFKTSLKTLQGVPAILAGAAMIAAGAAFRAAIPSFATGGTQYGPGLAMIGDNATQKEHILSDIQLQKIAQGAGIEDGGGELVARVSGSDLLFVYDRARKSAGRVNG